MSYTQTASGRLFHYEGMHGPGTLHDVSIFDIKTALPKICRYCGNCKSFYSVAQHSVLVSRQLPPHLKGWGLLHDAAEAYMGDIPSPLKRLLPEYKRIEDSILLSVAATFGLQWPMPADVKEADLRMLITEKMFVLYDADKVWEGMEHVRPYPFKTFPLWTPEESEAVFMEEFDLIFGD